MLLPKPRLALRAPFLASATLAFALLLPRAADAQDGTLSGVVTNESGQPVGTADVAIRGGAGPFRSVTNAQGRFSILLPPGTYDLVLTLIGHQTTAYDNVSVQAGAITTVEITMPTQATALTGLAVTVGRTQQAERTIDQPATTDVITSLEISERATFNSADYLREAPGVDVITTGLQNSNIVVRGFNNIFSGSLHMLSDYRLAGVPSLRVNLMHFIPTIDEDLDRMEVVLGPGSALYGPNTANGVVHLITKSPLDDQGTSVIVGGGTQQWQSPSAFQGAFRSAFLLHENVGVKVSGQYLSGEEWIFDDPAEEAARDFADENPGLCRADRLARGLTVDQAVEACGRIGDRDFDIERWSVEGRVDWRYADDGLFVATYGRNTSSGIELTGLGAGQVGEWVYDFFQARAGKGRFFAQAYYNRSNSGDSFLLRDGVNLVDESALFVGQLQHGFAVSDGRQDFTYGVDFFATTPASAGRIYGSYEAADEMVEWGAYLQSKTALTPQFDLIVAGRLDAHSILPDDVFSPRAALVYKPDDNTGVRLTYNSAFSTPTALNFFLDISGGFAPDPLGGLGFTSRAYGSGTDGFPLTGPDGTYQWMRSPFTPSGFGGPSQVVPADHSTMWRYWVGVVEAGGAIDGPTADFLRDNAPTDDGQVARLALDPDDNSVTPLAALTLPSVPPTRESNTQTFEIGYTGVIDNRVSIAADIYRTTRDDFVSPLIAETPVLFLNPADLETYLTPIVGPANAALLARAAGVDDQGNPNPLPLGVLGASAIPAQGADVVVSYRNVGDLTLWGGDISFQAFLTDGWALGGMYSYVSDDVFEIADGAPISLNAPQHKGAISLSYRNPARGVNSSIRVRANSAFDAFSADFGGRVAAVGLVDLTASYQIPNTRATLQLSMSNVLDNKYRSFPGVPKIGRFTMLRAKYDLF